MPTRAVRAGRRALEDRDAVRDVELSPATCRTGGGLTALFGRSLLPVRLRLRLGLGGLGDRGRLGLRLRAGLLGLAALGLRLGSRLLCGLLRPRRRLGDRRLWLLHVSPARQPETRPARTLLTLIRPPTRT